MNVSLPNLITSLTCRKISERSKYDTLSFHTKVDNITIVFPLSPNYSATLYAWNNIISLIYSGKGEINSVHFFKLNGFIKKNNDVDNVKKLKNNFI